MSIWLLLFFHYTQPLGPVAYLPWLVPDYFWSFVILNSWHVFIIYSYTDLLCAYAVMMSTTVVVCWSDCLSLSLYLVSVLQFMHMCMCVVYGLYEMSQFVRSVHQTVTGVCVLLLVICSHRYCLAITDVCLICLVFYMIILPVHHLLLVGSPLMVITVCLYDHSMCRKTPSSLRIATVDPVEKMKNHGEYQYS